MIDNDPAIYAYKFFDNLRDKKTNENNLEVDRVTLNEKIETLVSLSGSISSSLLKELKPTIALSIKWKFDYLTKTGESPFLIINDFDYWINILTMMGDLSTHQWFKKTGDIKESDVWKRTKEAFNFMWPKNTAETNYEVSKKMVEVRLEQIISMMEGNDNFIENSTIIDSGCGPGRYADVLSSYKPEKIIGIDSGQDIINTNKKRFLKEQNIEMILGSCESLPVEDNIADFVVSAGVLHHLPNPIEKLVAEHARVIKKNGYLFIFIAGTGGLELKIWEFLRLFLNDVPVSELYNRFHDKISPLRLQGLLDHGYGEYQQTTREDLESYLNSHFSHIIRVPGIEGLDVTEEIYKDDKYFFDRFGTGNLRYLCRK
jgi:ubiquinone/menaquinone biosynthesis C-methylase UbiE